MTWDATSWLTKAGSTRIHIKKKKKRKRRLILSLRSSVTFSFMIYFFPLSLPFPLEFILRVTENVTDDLNRILFLSSWRVDRH